VVTDRLSRRVARQRTRIEPYFGDTVVITTPGTASDDGAGTVTTGEATSRTVRGWIKSRGGQGLNDERAIADLVQQVGSVVLWLDVDEEISLSSTVTHDGITYRVVALFPVHWASVYREVGLER
jgi:hypothetical protein